MLDIQGGAELWGLMHPQWALEDTIAAIATPPGVGAIAIVRLSGGAARTVFSQLWINKAVSVDKLETHRFYYGKLSHPDPKTPQNSPDIHRKPPPIDTVMAVFFQAPRSYTGEDMVELYCHGGGVVAQEVLQACLSAGARMAAPGEFSRRAFLNGKMDLAQAEAVADVIHAASEQSRRRASEQLSGRLSQVIRRAMESLTELRAYVEATIDFPEEDIEMIAHAGISARLDPILSHLQQLAETYHAGRYLREGARVVLIGSPNVGKSSLMNRLLGVDRSIVHETPGTTRDFVDATWMVAGIPIQLVDTAGLREGRDAVEQLGIDRSHHKMTEADLLLVVYDGSREIPPEEYALDVKRALLVMNKSDLPQVAKLDAIKVSARTGDGIAALEERVAERLRGTTPAEVEGVSISNVRHFNALNTAISNLTAAATSIKAREAAEFVAHHLAQASQNLGEIVGEVTSEDVLAAVFSKFCIGK